MIVYFHFIDSMLIFSLDSSRPRWTMFRLGIFRINNLEKSTISRDSSVGRASDWRSEGPWFNAGELNWALNYPGSRQFLFLKCTINASNFKNIFWTSHWVLCICYVERSLQPTIDVTQDHRKSFFRFALVILEKSNEVLFNLKLNILSLYFSFLNRTPLITVLLHCRAILKKYSFYYNYYYANVRKYFCYSLINTWNSFISPGGFLYIPIKRANKTRSMFETLSSVIGLFFHSIFMTTFVSFVKPYRLRTG